MEQNQPKHLSPWIAWSLVIGAFGVALFCTWYYYFQVGVAYDNAFTNTLHISKKSSSTTTPVTASTELKSYSNLDYGFGFNYPKDWTVTEKSLSNSLLNLVITNSTVNNSSSTDNPGLASITVYKSLNSLDTKNLGPSSIKDYLDKYAAITDPIYQNVAAKKIGNKDGYTAKMGPNQFGGGSIYVATVGAGYIATIRTYNTGITQDQVDKILSSFYVQ